MYVLLLPIVRHSSSTTWRICLTFFFLLLNEHVLKGGFPDQRRTERYRTTGLSDQKTTGASERVEAMHPLSVRGSSIISPLAISRFQLSTSQRSLQLCISYLSDHFHPTTSFIKQQTLSTNQQASQQHHNNEQPSDPRRTTAQASRSSSRRVVPPQKPCPRNTNRGGNVRPRD